MRGTSPVPMGRRKVAWGANPRCRLSTCLRPERAAFLFGQESFGSRARSPVAEVGETGEESHSLVVTPITVVGGARSLNPLDRVRTVCASPAAAGETTR